MTSAVARLTALLDANDRYEYALTELLPTQIAAANERLSNCLGAIKLLANRAETADVRTLREPADLVPLLFSHTAYKSYPENWLAEGKWDRMAKWLDTVSAHRVNGLDTAGLTDIDDWLERLAAVGHYVSCSSGTTGKVSMINSAMADRQFNKRVTVQSFAWATGLPPDHAARVFVCNPSGNNFRNIDTTAALAEAYGIGGEEYRFPGARITVGQVRRMVALRRSIADGSARPGDIAAYGDMSAAREKAMNDGVDEIAEAMIASRGQKLLIIGMYALLFRVAQQVQSLGYGGKDFHPDNSLMVGGGLKGAVLPADFFAQICATFNLARHHIFHMYAMQECSTQMPRCRAGRYHVAPWLMLLVLDKPGETLIPPGKGEVEGRAAFFDLSHEGRWGGVISGDRIKVDYGTCACGRPGPTINSNIVRYVDLEGEDKISCAGTIDAYVRGAA